MQWLVPLIHACTGSEYRKIKRPFPPPAAPAAHLRCREGRMHTARAASRGRACSARSGDVAAFAAAGLALRGLARTPPKRAGQDAT